MKAPVDNRREIVNQQQSMGELMRSLNPRPKIPDVIWWRQGAFAPRQLTKEERERVISYLVQEFGIESRGPLIEKEAKEKKR